MLQYHAVKANKGRGDKVPHIRNLGTAMEFSDHFTLRPSLLPKKEYPLIVQEIGRALDSFWTW